MEELNLYEAQLSPEEFRKFILEKLRNLAYKGKSISVESAAYLAMKCYVCGIANCSRL